MRKIILILSLIIVILVIILLNAKNLLKIIYKQEYSEYVEKYAKENEIDPLLVYAIIKAESNFDENAVSASNAKGLMQLMYATAEEVAEQCGIELTEENIFDPEINIELGTRYISTLIERYTNIGVALAAYNAGMTSVDKWLREGTISADGSDIENIPFKETNNYVRKILRDYEVYKEL